MPEVTKDTLSTLIDAAQSWHDELNEYVIPEADPADQPAYRAEADKLTTVIREAQHTIKQED